MIIFILWRPVYSITTCFLNYCFNYFTCCHWILSSTSAWRLYCPYFRNYWKDSSRRSCSTISRRHGFCLIYSRCTGPITRRGRQYWRYWLISCVRLTVAISRYYHYWIHPRHLIPLITQFYFVVWMSLTAFVAAFTGGLRPTSTYAYNSSAVEHPGRLQPSWCVGSHKGWSLGSLTTRRSSVTVGQTRQPSCRAACMSACIDNVASWMKSNKLQLNASKTEVLWCTSSRHQHQLPVEPLWVCSDAVTSVQCVRDLGICVDSDLSMRTHVQRTVSSCFAVLRQLRSICRSVSRPVMMSLVVSLVLTRLWQCYAGWSSQYSV